MDGNLCNRGPSENGVCQDKASSSDWLFGLSPGPPEHFESTGSSTLTRYQNVWESRWPQWGEGGGGWGDLYIGQSSPGESGQCEQGATYRGTAGEICGGDQDWGATDVEVWYPA